MKCPLYLLIICCIYTLTLECDKCGISHELRKDGFLDGAGIAKESSVVIDTNFYPYFPLYLAHFPVSGLQGVLTILRL